MERGKRDDNVGVWTDQVLRSWSVSTDASSAECCLRKSDREDQVLLAYALARAYH